MAPPSEAPSDGAASPSADELRAPAGPLQMSEEDVRREKEESLARTAAASAQIRAQEEFLRKIEELAIEGDDAAGGAGAGALGAEISGGPSLGDLSTGSAYQQHLSAQVLQEKIFSKEYGLERVEERTREELESQQRQHELIAERHLARDLCAQRRIDEQARRVQIKVRAAQQRKADQQRTFLEYAREVERVRESNAAKMRGERPEDGGSGEQRPRSPSEPRGAPPRSCNTFGDESGDFFKDEVLVMHNRNNEELDRARQFLEFGQYLSNKHCKKLLGPSGPAYVDRLLDRAPRVATTPSSKCDQTRSPARTRPASPEKTPSHAKSLWDTARSRIRTVSALSSTSWSDRLKRCSDKLEETSRLQDERWASQSDNLSTSRSRKKDADSERVQLLHAYGEAWAVREKTAKLRRQKDSCRSDSALVERHAAFAERRAEVLSQADEIREHRAAQKRAATLNTKQRCLRNAELFQTAGLERQAEKDQQTIVFYGLRFEEFDNRPGAKGHAERTQEKLARKKALDDGFKEKAKAEIAAKKMRHAEAAAKLASVGLEQRCKDKRALRLEQQQQAKKEREGIFIQPEEEEDGGGGAASLLQADGACSAEPSPLSKAASDSFSLMSPLGSTISPQGSPKSFVDAGHDEIQALERSLSMLQQRSKATQQQRKHSAEPRSDSESSGAENEQELIQELEQKGERWLKQIRKKYEDQPRRFC